MTSFREILADLIREYFAIPRSTPEVQAAAANWQRAQLPRHLERSTNYQPGMYTRRYHLQLEREIQRATTPNFTRIATTPLAARDIQYASTPLPTTITEDDDDATEMRPAIKLSKATPTLEIPAITGEILLMELMRGPISPHDTGEQAPVKISEDAFLL